MATVIQDARADAPPGTFEPVTFQEAMLEARGTIRRMHNRAVYHLIPVTGAAVDGRPFPEGKASLYKQVATGEFVPFTVAARSMTDKGPNVSVAVERSKRKFTRVLVHHTAAVVVRITVESIDATHGVSEQQLAEPLYLVLALNNADVVADLAYTTEGGSTTGTVVPVHFIAAALKGEDLSDIKWGGVGSGARGREARATEAWKVAVRKGLCRRDQVPGILDPILRAHVQTLRAQSEKLWAGEAARAPEDVDRELASAQARPSRAAAARPSRVQPLRTASARAAQDSDSARAAQDSDSAPSPIPSATVVDGVDGLVAVLSDASVFPTVSLALVKTLIGPIHLNDEQKRRILQACERRLNEDEAFTRSWRCGRVVRQLRELLAPSSEESSDESSDSDASSSDESSATSSSSSSSPGDGDGDTTPKPGANKNKRDLIKSGKKGEDKKRPSRGQDSS